MRVVFEYPWKLEIANSDMIARFVGSPVVFEDWSIESNAAQDWARIKVARSLLTAGHSNAVSEYITFGDVQNPGWDRGFVARIYADGSFVAADNSGKCRAYGSLDQFHTDFSSVKKRILTEGLFDLAKEPITLGTDHYRTRFIEVTENGIPNLRTDAVDINLMMNGAPPTKRKAFEKLYVQEEAFINSMLNSGMKLPASKN